jgi:hypothetical protein
LNTSPAAIGVLHPEQVMRLERAPEPGRLDGRQPVMHVVEQVHVRPELAPQPFEDRGSEGQVALAAPPLLGREAGLRRLVVVAGADAVRVGHAGYAALGADGAVPGRLVARDGGDRLVQRGAAGMAVHQDRLARGAA